LAQVKIDRHRRAALKLLAGGSLLGLGTVDLFRPPAAHAVAASQPEVSVLVDFLSACIAWVYPQSPRRVQLEISRNEDMSAPVVKVSLPDTESTFRFAVAPDTTYFWQLSNLRDAEEAPLTGRFHSGVPVIDDTAEDAIRYRNPRVGAHWVGETTVVPVTGEPLAPWFDRKTYSGSPAPRFDAAMKSRLPEPILENGEALLNLYWYCWQTFFDVWFFSPTANDHQAVANLIGFREWGAWGSTMVWDTCFMLHFARYGQAAYPFITGLDNCYARQHENGFICRESDAQNREVYYEYPVNPPLFAWAEWQYFQISGDVERLRRVLTPVVKHYAWWMTYQRRANGRYWNAGIGEGMDDSPRNSLAFYTMSAAAEQALAALALSRICRVVDRADLAAFFEAEHSALGRQINDDFWDQDHQIYNDRTKDWRFITELQPGVLCKHAFIFWPLVAEVSDRNGTAGLVAELTNPKSFSRPSGIASLSADSRGYREDGQYWKGSVWPPVQCIVQEGLRVQGRWHLARELADKYLKAMLEAFEHEQTVTENLEPDNPKGHGAKQFVGWGGIGPIANLIEYTLGFHVNAPERTIEWRIERTDRHGIRNLSMAAHAIDLLCERRTDASSPCRIEVHSSLDFMLKVVLQDRSTTYQIKRGRSEITTI